MKLPRLDISPDCINFWQGCHHPYQVLIQSWWGVFCLYALQPVFQFCEPLRRPLVFAFILPLLNAASGIEVDACADALRYARHLMAQAQGFFFEDGRIQDDELQTSFLHQNLSCPIMTCHWETWRLAVCAQHLCKSKTLILI